MQIQKISGKIYASDLPHICLPLMYLTNVPRCLQKPVTTVMKLGDCHKMTTITFRSFHPHQPPQDIFYISHINFDGQRF